MTTDEAIALIKIEMPEAESPKKTQEASAALQAALNAINRLGDFEYNRVQMSVTLDSGVSKYTSRILFKGLDVRRIDQKIYLDDNSGDYIDLETHNEFSRIARGDSSSGKPQLATAYGNPLTIEVWPTPDQNYDILPVVTYRLDQIEQAPADIADLVIERALIQVLDDKTRRWAMADKNWSRGVAAINKLYSKGFRRWKGKRAKGDPWGLGRSHQRAKRRVRPDSHNLLGGDVS